jgi:RNA polymerase sigma factor (TIGR02999 family)
VRNEDQHWENRRHFFSAAAEAMRRILIDRARKHHSEKRGGGKRRVEFDPDVIDVVTEERSELLLHLEEALQELERLNERQAQIVKLRYFTGLTIEETAKILGVSTATVVQDWRFARAWLKERMAPSG